MSERASDAEVIRDLAHSLTPEKRGTGQMAALRRMDPERSLPAAFWMLMAKVHRDRPELSDRAWAVVVQAMAEMAPDPHDPKAALGIVLAETDYAEGRFVRLLRADAAAMPNEVRTLARWCRVKARPIDWVAFGHFVLARMADRDEDAEKDARRFARQYFGKKSRDARPATAAAQEA
jgi:hypothetical protein